MGTIELVWLKVYPVKDGHGPTRLGRCCTVPIAHKQARRRNIFFRSEEMEYRNGVYAGLGGSRITQGKELEA